MQDYFILLSFYDMGIMWIAIPAFIVYPVVSRLFRQKWCNLFSWVDIVSCLMIHVIWFYGLTHDFNSRGAGRLLDIFYLSLLYGIIILVRIPFVWCHPEWRTRIATISLLILICVSIALALFINLATIE